VYPKVFLDYMGRHRVRKYPSKLIRAKPWKFARVAVAAGQQVKARDLLLTIEAMKMETGFMPSAVGSSSRLTRQQASGGCQRPAIGI